MLKEFEFFIQDDAPGVWALSQRKKDAGAILVENIAGFFRELSNRTEAGDRVAIVYSGGVVEDCLLHTAQELLTGSPRLTGVEIESVTVDMTTSVAFAESVIPLSVQERRNMFINLLGSKFSEDPRFTVLPESR